MAASAQAKRDAPGGLRDYVNRAGIQSPHAQLDSYQAGSCSSLRSSVHVCADPPDATSADRFNYGPRSCSGQTLWLAEAALC